MAEKILQNNLNSTSDSFTVRSAGLTNTHKSPADPFALSLVPELEQHRSTVLDQALCNWADIILVMETNQLDRIHRYFPSTRGKVFLLLEKTKEEIEDPYKKSKEEFERALTSIKTGVEHWCLVLTR